MTDLSRAPRGYAQDSRFPAECGGPLRLKSPLTPGLALAGGERLTAHGRMTMAWNVMFLWHGNDRLYLTGTALPGATDPSGWVAEIDPETLTEIARSPALPTGGHIWCGALVMHEDGGLYNVNGRYLHRLTPDLTVTAECELPADRPYNGVLVMGDGCLLTKELRLGGGPSSFVVLEPGTLTIRQVLEMPEPSMGRIAADRQHDGSDHIYVPGNEHIFRYVYRDGVLARDAAWTARYRGAGSASGLAWDSCIADGGVWLFDNGDIPAVRDIHRRHPAGSAPPSFDDDAFPTPVRLYRVAIDDPGRIDVLEPSGLPNGWVIAPPVYVPGRRIVVGFDTGNATVRAWRHRNDGGFEPLWTAPVMNWLQPMVYADTGELVMDDRTDADDNIVVLDLERGIEKARVATGSPLPNGMFLCPGRGRDLFYCSTPAIARIAVVSGGIS